MHLLFVPDAAMKKADPFNMFHQHFHSMLEGAEHC
jgi:hypothetical protein